MPDDPVELAFHNVILDFKDRLKDDKLCREILKTTSIDEVYDATDKIQAEQAINGHLRHLSKVGPYLDRLRDYSGVIETFVQAKPSILAFIWGPIKLLIQWTSTMRSSFDAVVNTTAEIGELLPEFKTVSNLFSHNNHLKDVLVLFFQDLLDFYVVTLRFFSQTSKLIVETASYENHVDKIGASELRSFLESLWPRQKDKINLVITRIQRHKLLMRSEVRLEHIREEHEARIQANEHFEKMEKVNRLQEFRTIEAAISPRSYDDRLNWISSRTCDGTGKWLPKDPTLVRWLDVCESSPRVLWLQGIPGAGKTFLSAGIINLAARTGRVVFAFLDHAYHCSTSALSVLHSLIFQLASGDPDLQDLLIQSSRDNLRNNTSIATSLLTGLLNCAGRVFIIIDGVDEIEQIERAILLRQLLDLSRDCHDVRIMVSCRLEADIARVLGSAPVTIRVDNHNAGSIQAFVNRQSRIWLDSKNFLPAERAEIEALLSPVAANAKGMFLYAKVLLTSFEFLSDINSIRNEFKVLPENLDAAYSRILMRINSLSPITARKQARSILGWVGCSPTPLTVQEIEQAITIDAGGLQTYARSGVSLNVIELCGPVIEVIDDYVHFVHFTAKEYLFSTQISDHISNIDATLDLAKRCIYYLCHSHHDSQASNDELRDNLMSGDYRFHAYATATWLELVEIYGASRQSADFSTELILALESLEAERYCGDSIHEPEPNGYGCHAGLERLKDHWPNLYEMVRNVAWFREKCNGHDYHLNKSKIWTGYKPFTTYNISMATYELVNEAMCQGGGHKKDCFCHLLRHKYGQHPFKCGFLGCSFRRRGFTSRRTRDSHERHHERPWKCPVQSCQYAEIGFLSRRMQNDHLDFSHREAKAENFSMPNILDEDTIQPLMFDLVRLNKVEAVQALLPFALKLPLPIRDGLAKSAAFAASGKMMDLLQTCPEFTLSRVELFICTIEGGNEDTFVWYLARVNKYWKWNESSTFRESGNNTKYITNVLIAFLKTDSEKITHSCQEILIYGFSCWTVSFFRNNARFVSKRFENMIRETSECPDRERRLVHIWKAARAKDPDMCLNNEKVVGSLLCHIAKFTSSVTLAIALLDCGAHVDARGDRTTKTALQCAAARSSLKSANFIKFLLYRGANPELKSSYARRTIREEKGAREIAKWIGMSWDELLEQVKQDRERGYCPPEYQ